MTSNTLDLNKYDHNLVETREVIKVNYDVGLKKVVLIKSGMINTSFVVYCEKHMKLLFRVYKNGNKTKSDIEKELEISERLSCAGLPVPRVFRNNKGQRVTKFVLANKTWYAVMFEFLDGRHLKHSDRLLVEKVSLIHATMHGLLKVDDFEKVRSFVEKLLSLIKTEYISASKKLAQGNFNEVGGRLNSVYEEVKRGLTQEVGIISKLPSGFCHLDFDSSNILTDGKKIKGVIDFDDMDIAPFVADIAFSLWWWMFYSRFDFKLAESYIENYSRIKKISKEELKFLQIFLRARNLFLLCVLFVNSSKGIKMSKVKLGLKFDSVIKSNY